MKTEIYKIAKARSAIFAHCGEDDCWDHLAILDCTDNEWDVDHSGDASYWPEGHALTDPDDDDYMKQEQTIESAYLMAGPKYTIVVGGIQSSRREEMWLLDNSKRFAR